MDELQLQSNDAVKLFIFIRSVMVTVKDVSIANRKNNRQYESSVAKGNG